MKKTINNLLSKLVGYRLIKSNINLSILHSIDKHYGHSRSRILKQAIDAESNPIPWFTYPAFEFISQFSLQQKSVFEWGSGNSSLYFLPRCKRLVSVESNQEWYNKVKGLTTSKHEMILSTLDNYALEITRIGLKFDLIIVDGDRRFDCCVKAVEFLNKGGMIILDNSDWHPKSCELMRNHGFTQIDMAGFGPINSYSWVTSFFFLTSFDFPLLGESQPSWSLAGLHQISKWDHPTN